MPLVKRPYQGDAQYESQLDDETDTQSAEPGSHDTDTLPDGPEVTPEETTFKKRYGDLRTHTHSLNQRISDLQRQLSDASRQEIKIPSTPTEIQGFANQYPDVYRHILTIARTELIREKDDLLGQTRSVQADLDTIKRERGIQKILSKHKDFDEVNASNEFHEWAQVQPKEIQDFVYASDDPDLCIKAIDLYKSETGYKKAKAPKQQGADFVVTNRGSVEIELPGNKRVWKDSEIRRMHAKDYERHEADIDLARREGRYDVNA